MPPCHNIHRFKYAWSFGYKQSVGYCVVGYKGKRHKVHQIICRAFHGLPPEDKPFCDHINRIRDDNRSSNLRWTSSKGNCDNQAKVDQALEKYGVRSCEDRKAYNKARYESHGRAHWAVKIAEMHAQGLVQRKGPDGKWGWFPRIRS